MKTITAITTLALASSAVMAAPLRHDKQLKPRDWNCNQDDAGDHFAFPESWAWTHLANQDQSIDYDGTISYTNQPGSGAGFYDFYLDPNTVAFSIMSGKKCDRGTFTVGQVMHDGSLTMLGSGDQYDPNNCDPGTASQSLFYYDVPEGQTKSYRVFNSGFDGRIGKQPYLAVDYIQEYKQ